MHQLKPLAMVLVLGLYYLMVLAPLRETLEAVPVAGDRPGQNLGQELSASRLRVVKLQFRLASKVGELSDRFGTMRLADAATVTQDHLLESIHRACRESGSLLRSAAPIARTQTDFLELQGLQCSIELAGEPSFSTFLNALGHQDRAPYAMVHRLDLTRQGSALRLSLGTTILRRRADATRKGPTNFDQWFSIRRERCPFSSDWLLSPRPATAPTRPPPLASRPAPVTRVASRSASAAPPAPAFGGRLLGVATRDDGKDLAVLDTGSGPRLFAVGEKVDAWTVARVAIDHVLLESGTQTSSVYFNEEDRPRPAAAAAETPVATSTAPTLGARQLGLSAVPQSVDPAQPPPAPFASARRVFAVNYVEDGSIASRAGLRPGDRILAIDGTPLRVREQLLGLRTRVSLGQSCSLAVERNRSIVQIAVGP